MHCRSTSPIAVLAILASFANGFPIRSDQLAARQDLHPLEPGPGPIHSYRFRAGTVEMRATAANCMPLHYHEVAVNDGITDSLNITMCSPYAAVELDKVYPIIYLQTAQCPTNNTGVWTPTYSDPQVIRAADGTEILSIPPITMILCYSPPADLESGCLAFSHETWYGAKLGWEYELYVAREARYEEHSCGHRVLEEMRRVGCDVKDFDPNNGLWRCDEEDYGAARMRIWTPTLSCTPDKVERSLFEMSRHDLVLQCEAKKACFFNAHLRCG